MCVCVANVNSHAFPRVIYSIMTYLKMRSHQSITLNFIKVQREIFRQCDISSFFLGGGGGIMWKPQPLAIQEMAQFDFRLCVIITRVNERASVIKNGHVRF